MSVKIDIHITDATPVEAQRVLMGISFAEEILGKISPAIKIEKAQKPDPTCDEETGCKDCNPDQFHEGCEKCSPAPSFTEIMRAESFPKAQAAVEKPRAKRPGNKYGIPTELSKTNLKEYQRLWALCKAHNITYEQAKARKRRPTRTPGNTVKPSAQAIASSNDMKEPLPTIPASAIVIGAHVQQTRPDAGRRIFGTGVVVDRHGEIVDVRDGAGKVHKIIAACLEAVTGPVSDRATGVSS